MLLSLAISSKIFAKFFLVILLLFGNRAYNYGRYGDERREDEV